MKNVKAIELTRDTFGLPKGTVLSRLTATEPFAYKAEHVADDYQYSNSLSISPTVVTWDFAKPIEWFEDRRRSARHTIEELEAKIKELTVENTLLSAESKAIREDLESLRKRAEAKRDEYQKKMNELQLDLENDIIAGESTEWADEAMTVYYNLVDFINKLLA